MFMFQVIPLLLQNLPLKEDMEEVETVYKCVISLLQTGETVVCLSITHKNCNRYVGLPIYLYFLDVKQFGLGFKSICSGTFIFSIQTATRYYIFSTRCLSEK